MGKHQVCNMQRRWEEGTVVGESRVPTITELESIIDCGLGEPILLDYPGQWFNGRIDGCMPSYPPPRINTQYFYNGYYDEFYWSATPMPINIETAWHVFFYYGSSSHTYRSSYNKVRLVRSAE